MSLYIVMCAIFAASFFGLLEELFPVKGNRNKRGLFLVVIVFVISLFVLLMTPVGNRGRNVADYFFFGYGPEITAIERETEILAKEYQYARDDHLRCMKRATKEQCAELNEKAERAGREYRQYLDSLSTGHSRKN